MQSAAEIEQQAAAWLARRESGTWSDTDQAALAAWIAASTANRIALLRLETVWDKSGRLRASAVPLHAVAAESRASSSQRFWFATKGLAVAAGIALAVIVGSMLLPSAGEAYATGVGGFQKLPLADGSKIDLNTDTRVVVTLETRQRSVQLERGEAFFEVAKDRARPFVVRAGAYRVIALGTAFSVRLIGDKIDVAVAQGQVRVEKDAMPAPAFVSAGQVAVAGLGTATVHAARAEEMDRMLSWRDGLLMFDARPLGEVAAEFNRYNSRQIRVDPSAAAVRVDGTFKATNIDGFVRLLGQGFKVKAVPQGTNAVLLKRG